MVVMGFILVFVGFVGVVGFMAAADGGSGVEPTHCIEVFN